MSLNLQFLGATETVTGSRFLVTNGTEKVLVDAGLFQGIRDIRKKNSDPFPIAPSELSAVLLTHAHLDHCGYLPKLVREGFDGPIYCTPYTSKLASIVLRDAAKLQTEDAKYAKKKGYSKHKEPAALYDLEEAERAISKIGRAHV